MIHPRRWLVLFFIISNIFISSCLASAFQSSTTTITLTESPNPTITKQPTNTILPTSTSIACPPFEIDHEVPEPNTPENYIGRHYDVLNLPNKLEFHQGTSILGEGNYGFTIITSAETLQMIWFEKLICLNNKGKTFDEIIDATVLPTYSEKDTLGYWYCSINEVADPEIIALGESQCGVQYLLNIKQAWRLNRQTEKIETVSTENIVCQLNDGICVPH
jgi:hypothetical protein